MAPSPEHDKEPKAPDKGHSQLSDNISGDIQVQVSETQQNSDTIPAAAGASGDTEESGQLESLDESQLKALLDEAVNYKRPKDREGKSSLFKELLLEVEQDSGGGEPSCAWGARACGSASSRRRASRRGPQALLAHSGSLQDLALAHSISLSSSSHHAQLHHHTNSGAGSHSNRRRANAHHNVVPVSARSLQGGSLPANVDQQNFGGVEGGRNFLDNLSTAYVATVCCVNPPPLGKDAPPSHTHPQPHSHSYSQGPDYMLIESPTATASRRAVSPHCSPHSRAASASLTTHSTHPNDPAPAPSALSLKDDRHYCDDNDDDRRHAGSHLEIRSPKSPRVPANYTTTLEIGSSSASTSITTLTVSSNHSSGAGSSNSSSATCSTSYGLVDTTHGCISSPQVVPTSQLTSVNYSKDSSIVGITASPSSSSSSCGSSSLSGQPGTSSQVSYITSCSRLACAPKHDHTDLKKSFDENGNTVQGGNNQQKKQKRKQKCKNETETISNEIVGYRGSETLDVILKFIESTEGGGKNCKAKPNPPGLAGKPPTRDGKARDDNDAAHDKAAKKRSTERRSKDNKTDKLKKANSMEELSRSKLHDLTNEPSDASFSRIDKRTVFRQPDADAKRTDRRSWGNDGSDSYYGRQDGPPDDADDSFSANASNGSTSSVTAAAAKPKRPKTPRSSGDLEAAVTEPLTTETSDFQTVTNKKKIRKRHSPSDDSRGRSNNPHTHNSYGGKNPPRFGNNFTTHDRDGIYRRFGRTGSAERRHPSASSPPSDKSNDSNDDLDSVHSLPAEASGERLQASYADMARAATQPPPVRPPPVASPPPPPPTQNHIPASPPTPAGHRNFPDLIESCNYYPANDRQPQDKYLDVSTENTKNLMLKALPVDPNKTKINNGNVETEILPEQTDVSNPIYNHEQYPALEPRSIRPADVKIVNSKTKIEPKLVAAVASNNGPVKVAAQTNAIRSPPVEKKVSPSSKTVTVQDGQTRIEDNSNEEDIEKVADHYLTIVNNVNPSDIAVYGGENNNPAKVNFIPCKMDNFAGKPPDVILPSTEIPQNDNRPAVIIMNEELKKSSERIHNIDGITFGFDINEQLLNGDACVISDNGQPRIEDVPMVSNEGKPATIMYNSNVEFPAINEKCRKELNSVKDKSPSSPSEEGKTQAKSRGNKSESDATSVDLHKEEVVVGQAKSLRYVAPVTNPKDAYNLENIVRYVGMAWEDIMKSSGSKMPYFSKQQ